MRVRLFAALRELAGGSHVDVEATTVPGILRELSSRFGPAFDHAMAAGTIVINGDRADPTDERTIDPGDEIALLPPVSGGSASTTEEAWT